MTKIRLNNNHRDILRAYGQEKTTAMIDRTKEKAFYAKLIEGANEAIRTRFPEEHMTILRLYNLTHVDRCLRFQFPSSRVDGFYFKADDAIADMPYRRDCSSNQAFAVNQAFESAYDQYAKLHQENQKKKMDKYRAFVSLITAAKTLEDVLEVIDLPIELQEQLGRKCTALVALSEESLKALRKDFQLKTAA